MRTTESGAFVIIEQDGGPYFIKMATTNLGDILKVGAFVEVASLMLSTSTYFGACQTATK